MPIKREALAALACAWFVTFQGCGSASTQLSEEASASGRSSSSNSSASKTPWMPRQSEPPTAVKPAVSAAAAAAPVQDDDDAGVRASVDMRGQAGAAAGQAGRVSAGTAAAGAGAGGVDAAMPVSPVADPPACARDTLLQRQRTYLDAMANGDLTSLPLHPKVFYTENGQEQRLGSGVWTSRPKAQFTRYALDTQQCGSVTVAVLSDRFGAPLILGLRLRYVDDLLIDAEAMVVRRDPQLFAPEAIAVSGPDPWLALIPDDRRSSRDAHLAVAEAFFQSIVLPDVAPPRATTCKLRQNGVEVGGGNCAPGAFAERFEQLRYPVVDETTGLVGAIGLGRDYLVMFLFKIEDGTLINIDAIGGHAASASGW